MMFHHRANGCLQLFTCTSSCCSQLKCDCSLATTLVEPHRFLPAAVASPRARPARPLAPPRHARRRCSARTACSRALRPPVPHTLDHASLRPALCPALNCQERCMYYDVLRLQLVHYQVVYQLVVTCYYMQDTYAACPSRDSGTLPAGIVCETLPGRGVLSLTSLQGSRFEAGRCSIGAGEHPPCPRARPPCASARSRWTRWRRCVWRAPRHARCARPAASRQPLRRSPPCAPAPCPLPPRSAPASTQPPLHVRCLCCLLE